MTPEEILALVQLVGELATKGMDAYEKMRELAAKAGVSEADLAAADARFFVEIHDPLAAPPAPPATDPYSIDYDAIPPYGQGSFLKIGDRIYEKPDGKFRVIASGVGIYIPPDWKLIVTIADGMGG